MYQNVRRNPINHPQRFPDPRVQSNPQTIPRNQGHGHVSMQRGTSTNYSSYNTHGQSPQHPHQYVTQAPYPAVNPEMNSHVVPGSSAGKPHANGQYVWTNQQQRMPYQAQAQQGQFPTYQSNLSNPNPQFVYVPAAHPVRARFTHPVQPHPQHQMQGTPPTFYAGGQQVYSSQFASVPGAFTQSYDTTYQHGSQQSIHPSMPSHNPAPSNAPPPKKKVITIKDPDTMEDVTSDVLHSGKRTESESSSGPPSASPVTVVTTQQDQIAAQFAAQVAAAATESHDRNTRTAALSEVNSIIPHGVDTSVPPPSLQSIPHTLPMSTQNLPNASKVNANTNKVANGTPAASEMNGSAAASETNGMTNGAAIPSQRTIGSGSRPGTLLAIVQPVARPTAQREVKIKPSPVAAPKIEKILSRGEVLPPLMDSKSTVADDKEVTDEAATTVEIPEGASTSAAVLTSPPLREAKLEPEPEPELPYLEMAESVSVAVADSEKCSTAEVDSLVPEQTARVDPGANPKKAEVNGARNSDASNTDATLQATKTESCVAELDAMVLSGGDTVVETQSKPLEPAPESKPAAPKAAEKAPALPLNASLGSSQGSRDLKSQESRDASREKEAIDSASKEEASKMVYDRDFLMKCREHGSTREKPDNLPDIDIIMDQCLNQIPTGLPSLSGFGGSDFTPNWMTGESRGRVQRQMSRGSQGSNQSRQGYGYQQSQKVIKKVSIQREPEPELSKAENAWKPSKLESRGGSTGKQTDEEKTYEVLKSVRAILNKLTPQKFTDLMKRFMQLPINTEVRLREVINLIFEKAIDEPNFCEAYANMCRVMSQHTVSTPSSDGGVQVPASPVIFRKVLLTRCQKEFEKDRSTESALDDMRKKVEEAKTPEVKQQLKEQLEIDESKERRRVLGNIRFIGELFKLQMLTEAIMHNCIMSLFRAHDEEKLESLCRLLTTIGRALDHVKGKPLMDQYFTRIAKIITERKISSRVRFMLKDVVDLRKSNWVPRAIKAQGPKTIEQIHQDAKEEKEQQALKAAAAANTGPPVKSQSRGSRMGSRNSSSHNLSEDGWTNVSQKPMRIDPQKMKFSKEHSKIDENVALIPNRGKQGWKSGSGSITKSGSGSFYRDNLDGGMGSRATPTTKNRFSALVGGSGGPDSMYSNRSGGRVSSQERSKSGSRGSAAAGESRNSGRNERQILLETARRLTSTERKPPAKGIPPMPKPVSEPKFDLVAVTKKINSTIEEYLYLHDVKEAIECFDEMEIPASKRHVIVKSCLESSLEKSSKDRTSISTLLAFLVKNDKLHPDQLMKGVLDNMEVAIDLELDLPKVWSCVAEQVAALFYSSDNKVTLHRLKEMAAPLMKASKAAVFVAELLKRLVEQTDLNRAIQLWKSSNLQFEFFLQSSDADVISNFLRKHDLKSFHDDANVKATTNRSSSKRYEFDELVSLLTQQLDKHSTHDPIFDWIESNISLKDNRQPDFVSALITAVSSKAIVAQGNGNLEVKKTRMSSRSILLKKFLDNEAKELQAVYALQKLFIDLEQPPNVLKVLFDCLYDEDVISEQTFFKWEQQSDDQSEGKGVALLSVRPFLTWLRQAEVESDE